MSNFDLVHFEKNSARLNKSVAGINFDTSSTRVSVREIGNSASDLALSPITRDIISCGSSASTVALGLALTASGVGSLLGGAALISGSIGMSSCAVTLAARAICYSTGQSCAQVSEAMSYASIGGMTLAIATGLSGNMDSMSEFAGIGKNLETSFWGFVGVGLAKNTMEFSFGVYDLGSSSFDLGQSFFEFDSAREAKASAVALDWERIGRSHSFTREFESPVRESVFDRGFEDFWNDSFERESEPRFSFGGDRDFDAHSELP